MKHGNTKPKATIGQTIQVGSVITWVVYNPIRNHAKTRPAFAIRKK